MLIIPDTNFLVYATKFKLWHEIERIPLVIIPEVVYELETLTKKGKGGDKDAARFVLDMMAKAKVEPRKGHADDIILHKARFLKEAGQADFAVATMDKGLSEKLKKEGIKVMGIRQKKLLVLG